MHVCALSSLFLLYYGFAVTAHVTYVSPAYLHTSNNVVGSQCWIFSDTTLVDISYKIFDNYFDLIHQEGDSVNSI